MPSSVSFAFSSSRSLASVFSDAVAVLSFLFLGINPIAPPGALNCSPDGTPDGLALCTYSESHCPVSDAGS